MKYRFWVMTIIVAVIITGVSSEVFAAYPQTMTTTSPFVNLPRPSDDPRWPMAFAHWDKREDTKEVLAALDIFEELARDKPESFEPKLWLCRVNYLMAMRERKERESYCNKSIAAGDAALKIKPGDDVARSWRLSSIVLIRDLTEEEYQEVAAIGLKYRPLRPLPVPDDDPLWAEAVKKYDARMDQGQALAAISDFKKLDAKYPNRIEAKLFLNWTYYYIGMIQPTDEEKAKLHGIGAKWGRKAVELEPRNPAANFAFASTLGGYAENTGMLTMIRHSIELGKAIMIVVEEDPTYMYGCFSRYLATSFSAAGELSFRVAEMLGFPQDLIIRASVFSTRQEPAYLDNYYRLGKMYLALNRKSEAKEALETVIKIDPATLKFYEAENKIFQKRARELYDEHFK
jgi:tetratricopeptide (TPR) repeat protein